MSGFLKLFFGGNWNGNSKGSAVQELVGEVLANLIEKSSLDVQYSLEEHIEEDSTVIRVAIEGEDEQAFRDNQGELLDAFQLFLNRVVQHNKFEEKASVVVDVQGFREESSRALLEDADRLETSALSKGKAVYSRKLAPKDRKVVHQRLSEDERIRSRSIGEGLYKKIKIYPVKGLDREAE